MYTCIMHLYTEHMENCRLNYYLDIILLFCHVDCSCEALWVGSCLTECHLHTGTYYIRRYTQEFMVHKLPEPKDKDLRPYIPSLALYHGIKNFSPYAGISLSVWQTTIHTKYTIQIHTAMQNYHIDTLIWKQYATHTESSTVCSRLCACTTMSV